MQKFLVILSFFLFALSTPSIANDVVTAQQLLTELGYNPGPVDGSYGAKTKRALEKFYATQNKKFDGELSSNEIDALETVLAKKNNNSNKPKRVKIVNLSTLPDEFFVSMANYTEKKMASPNARTIAIIYPIGELLTHENPENNWTWYRGATHKVVLTKAQTQKILSEVSKFLFRANCLSNKDRQHYYAEVKWWLLNGGASQSHQAYCKANRLILVSIDPDRKRNSRELKRVFFHELYHSFQKDLRNNCRGPNDLWVIEAGAEYFAQHSIAVDEGRPKSFVNNLLSVSLWHAKRQGTKMEDPGIAEKGMGALRLMIHKGWLDEGRILDGSFFNNCARVKEFKNSDPKVKYIKKHWHEIRKLRGVYRFNLSE
jgi:hypothetical protein|tara:strand:- start:440 stop:1552 length:1113 start_codon:yes stop_codon:yes gene_type:complete